MPTFNNFILPIFRFRSYSRRALSVRYAVSLLSFFFSSSSPPLPTPRGATVGRCPARDGARAVEARDAGRAGISIGCHATRRARISPKEPKRDGKRRAAVLRPREPGNRLDAAARWVSASPGAAPPRQRRLRPLSIVKLRATEPSVPRALISSQPRTIARFSFSLLFFHPSISVGANYSRPVVVYFDPMRTINDALCACRWCPGRIGLLAGWRLGWERRGKQDAKRCTASGGREK